MLGSVDSKSYVLVSELPLEVFRKHVVDETTSTMTGFTFVVLAIVQLAGGKIPEGMHYSIFYNDLFFLVSMQCSMLSICPCPALV